MTDRCAAAGAPATVRSMTRHAAVAAFLVAACSPPFVTVAPTNQPPHRLHRRAPDTVLITHTPPATPYVEVADLHLDAGSEGEPALINRLRDKAAEIGCDALWLQPVSHPDRVSAFDSGTQLRGVCLVYN